eukprot:gene27318-32999_t
MEDAAGTEEARISYEELYKAFVKLTTNQERLLVMEILNNKISTENGKDNPELVAQSRAILIAVLSLVCAVNKESNSALRSKVTQTCIILLSNLTQSSEVAQNFFELANLDKEDSKFLPFVTEYLEHNPQLELEDEDPEEDDLLHVASILGNICQVECGRLFMLKRSTNRLSLVANQIRSQHLVRRRGAAATLKNCLFDSSFHHWVVCELDVLSAICLPLVVPTPFSDKDKEGMDPVLWLAAENSDRKAEPDLEVMKLLLECLVLLCQKRYMRNELRKRKVYPIMRNLDLAVEDEGVSAVLYDVVNFLIGDEDPNEADEQA